MSIILEPDVEARIARRVASGRYNSASEVLRESLALLDDDDRKNREALRDEVLKGVEDLENGRYREFNSEDELRAFGNEIITQGMARLQSEDQIR
jgi:antitoxin ParD1/3/4